MEYLAPLAFLVLVCTVVLLIRGEIRGRRIERALDHLQRVGVLVTSGKETEALAMPMTKRQRIRWIERRMNGFLRATP